jgi:DNA-binding transcriptional MerR regulator
VSFIFQGFTRAEVMEIFDDAKLKQPSPKQIHYWSQKGLIKTDLISAKVAIYSFQTILDMMVLMMLVEQDVALAVAQQTLDFMRIEDGWGTANHSAHRYLLMSDGTRLEPLNDVEQLYGKLDGKTAWKAFQVDTWQAINAASRYVINKEWMDRLRPNERHYLDDFKSLIEFVRQSKK